MAEIIGLTASLITLAGVGAKLAKTLRDAADALHSADHEACLIAADISIFASSLTQLSKTLPMISNYDIPEAERLLQITEVLVLACSSLIDELQNYIGDPLASRMKSPMWIRALGWHFKWFFQRSKITFIKNLMESFKTNLVLLVSTMDLAVVIHQDAQHEVRESLKLQVETNLRFAEDAKANLLQCKERHGTQQPLNLIDNLNSAKGSADPSLDSVPALELPSHSLIPYEEEKSTLSHDVTSDQVGHGDEVVQVACLEDCPTELVGILRVQERTSEVAEELLKITPVTMFSWASPGATQGVRQSSRSRSTLDFEPSRTEKMGAIPRQTNSTLPKDKSPTSSLDLVENHPIVGDSTEMLDPLQFLVADESPVEPNVNENRDDGQDLQRLIRKIIEETLSAQAQKGEAFAKSRTQSTSPSGSVKFAAPHSKPDAHSFSVSNSAPSPQPPSTPPPPPMAAPPPPPPPPPIPDTAKEDGVLSKLEQILLGKVEQEAKKAEADKFSTLERLLRDQQQARIDKEAAKKKAALDAAMAAAEAKKKGDEDKLYKLEKLILAQKDEQLKREEALAAQRAAEAAEKAAAAEAAKKLLDAAKAAREEAEAKAAKEAEETRAAHEKALAEAKAAAEELEKAKKAAEEEAAKLKPSDTPKPPIKFKDALGRKFSFPWHLCKTWKGMEELIKQAFSQVEVIGPHVHEGHYDLVGPGGEIILPQVWETMVQPDWEIAMHMWPMPGIEAAPSDEKALTKKDISVKGSRLKEQFVKIFDRRPAGQDSGTF